VLPDPSKPSLPLLAKTTATWGQITTTKFPCHFNYSFSTQILPLLLLRLWLLLLVSLAFLLLLGSLLMPTSLLLLVFLLLMHASRPPIFHGHQNFKTATFLESGRDDSHLAPLSLRAPVLNLRQITFSKKESFGPNIVVVLANKFYLPCP
jgi:hypothetical protein